MGIQGLYSKLQPYGFQSRWRQHPEAGCPTPLLIDGPALAFWVYYRCLARHQAFEHIFDSVPSYGELGKAVLQWLGLLESFGFTIVSIFFDGILPITKDTVRQQRLEKAVSQLYTIRSVHASLRKVALRRASADQNDDALDIFTEPKPLSRWLQDLPPPPFLVPAVIEALRSSKWATSVAVVPSESDLCCAQQCRETEIVLTSDSDLIIHPISGTVMFLNDIDFKRSAKGDFAMSAAMYRPSDIAQRLGIKQHVLIRIGYELKLDPHLSLRDASRKATSDLSGAQQSDFEAFAVEYSPDVNKARLDDHRMDICAIHNALQQMDPRVSELAWGVLDAAGVCVKGLSLPLLHEDPQRASAWRVSNEIRQLALSLPPFGAHGRYFERDRRGSRVVSTRVEILSPHDVIERLATFTTMIRELRLKDHSSDSHFWLCMGSSMVLRSLKRSDSLPARRMVHDLMSAGPRSVTWADLHFLAQVQGTIYSFRMLQQMLKLSSAWLRVEISESDDHNDDTLRAIDSAMKHLESLPPVPKIFLPACEGLQVGSYLPFLESEIAALYDEVATNDKEGVEYERSTTTRSQRVARRGRGRKRLVAEAQQLLQQARDSRGRPKTSSTNPFDALSNTSE